MELRLLSAEDVDRALSMSEAVDINGGAYVQVSAKTALVPLRTPLEMPRGISLFMPAYLPDQSALAVKVVSIFRENPQMGLPTIHGLVLVLDGRTGRPAALIDGERLTALRTGAGAGAATRVLARPDAKVMGVLGAGAQSMDQVRAVLAVRSIEKVLIYTPSGTSAQVLAQRVNREFPGVSAEAVDAAAKAVRPADVVTAVTTSASPVIDPADVKPGTHINGVGSFRPDMREIPVDGLSGIKIFVDSLESAVNEPGDIVQPLQRGRIAADDLTEIGLVISQRADGRTSPDEVTFFKSVGTAAQDAATAAAVLDRAEKQSLGRTVSF